MKTYRARCHCGAIGYEYQTALAVPEWDVRCCQCGFCTRHASATTSDPGGSVRFFFEEPGVLQRYRFGTGNTDFVLCKRCGVYLGAVIETGAGIFATLNTRAMEGMSDLPKPRPVSYDDQGAQERLDRREKLFTPVMGGFSGTASD
ncbi:MAG: aldehyde-activating protein [Gammaproteobacteria bacterium]|nr:MAG: aldehyde-activating protein [Gammaproteobacteria bacterium]